MQVKFLKKFFQLESASAILLFLMAVLAMLWANSSFAFIHQQLINASLFWVNEGLMAVFFLLVTIELKRGYLEGNLRHYKQILLPAVAAVGGMIIPALLYLLINYDHPIKIKGWASPVATDIAFALGVLTLFGRRVPSALKLFLLALAIFDDIGAILIIAFFFSHNLSFLWLACSLLLLFFLYLLNRKSVPFLSSYLILGGGLWLCLLNAGVHPTISGVLVALMIPDGKGGPNLLATLEKRLNAFVAYFVMPLFALVNAGFSLHGLSLTILVDGIVLGIALGLFVGKQAGVFGFSWLLIRFRFAKLPQNTTWTALYGVSLLCGIGFTMSLFLGTLSFPSESSYLAEVRLGVIIGSILSGLVGALVLFTAFSKQRSSIVDKSIHK